jgi:hypothetical protein
LPRKCINDFSDIILNGSSRLWIYMLGLISLMDVLGYN